MDFALPRPLSTVISGPYNLSMAIDGQSIFVCLSLKPIFLKRSAATQLIPILDSPLNVFSLVNFPKIFAGFLAGSWHFALRIYRGP